MSDTMRPASSASRSGLVLELAEEFLDRYRGGERPPLKEYIDRHPDLAPEIRDVFPAMAMMERIAIADESLEADATGPAGPNGHRAAPQEQVGDYRVIREVGRGGMGVVYEAEQVSLGRHVALKILPPQTTRDARTRRRFEREAKAAAKLHHTQTEASPAEKPVRLRGFDTPYRATGHLAGKGGDAVLRIDPLGFFPTNFAGRFSDSPRESGRRYRPPRPGRRRRPRGGSLRRGSATGRRGPGGG